MNPQDADATLQQWLADEAAHLARNAAGAGVGLVPAAQAQGLSGLQLMQGQIEGLYPRAPIGATLDFVLLEATHGCAVFQGRPAAAHLNPLGTVHGGWYATLLDSALGCAVHTTLPAGKAYTTLELKVNMIRALTPQVPRVRALGQVIHVGGQTATAEARLVGADGKLYAHASTTCLIFPARPTAPQAA